MDFEKWLAFGERLGLQGKELHAFVTDQEKQVIEREERAAHREREHEIALEEKRRENAETDREAERERREAEERVERIRQEAEERTERIRQEAEHEKRDAERERHMHEMELEKERRETLRIQAEAAAGAAGAHAGDPHSETKATRPKLPKFDETRDDMDAFLERFERFATSQKWKKETWAVSLSPLLTGKGLQVYSSMPPADASDFDRLKVALLKRYQLTEEGFRLKFRDCKPETGETVFQFISRMNRYFDRWVQLAEIANSYDALQDLLIREQFLKVCAPEMALFLRERVPKSVQEMTRLAEQYIEAHGGSISVNKNARSYPPRAPGAVSGQYNKPSGAPSNTGYKPPTPASTRDRYCYRCDRKGHWSRDCLAAKPASSPQQLRKPAGAMLDKSKKRNPGRSSDRAGKHSHDNSTSDVDHEETFAKSSQAESKNTAGLCQAVIADGSPVQSLVKDGCLELKNGSSIPCVSGACDKHTTVSSDEDMPVCQGFVGEHAVKVLRDTGCSSAAVKSDLVEPDQMTGRVHLCVLIDGTARRFPIAKVKVNTPYYIGEVEAMCMKQPIYDLVIGNIPGVRNDPDENWMTPTDETSGEASAVTTRAQAEKDKRALRPLIVPTAETPDMDLQKLKEAQQKDTSLQKFWNMDDREQPIRSGGTFWMKVCKGVLYRFYKKTGDSVPVKQIMVPSEFRRQVMKLAHEGILGGHLATQKTVDRIRTSFQWPGLVSDVTRYCRSCDICQRTIPKGRVARVPLGRMPVMDEPFQRIAVDLIGAISPVTDKGNRYILTVVDYATRYPEAVALPKIEAERVAEALLSVFCRVGFPREVLSDCGTQFTSEVMREVSRLISMRQLFTTPYNPRCNGLCERINGVLKSMLKKMCQERPQDWDRYLPAVLFAYREVPQASTGFSPFELLYGRTVRGPMQVLKELWTGSDTPEVKTTYQYVLDLRNRLEDTCQLARESILSSQEEYRHYYDKKTKNRRFKLGDKVLLLLPTDHNKLTLQWKGPYKVVEVVNRMDYKVEVKGKIKIYHANLLKRYVERDKVNDDEQQEPDNRDIVAAIVEAEIHDDIGVVDDEQLLELGRPTTEETYKDVKISEDLTESQRQEMLDLVEEFQDVFSSNPGTTDLAEHRIELTTDSPVRLKPYPIPYHVESVIAKEVKSMLEGNIIEPSSSPYSSPIVLVRKPDKSVRFCLDFRRLNSITVFDSEPMDNPEDIIAMLGNDQYFTKIDLCKGYWQIPIAKESQSKTAFVTPQGCFQFKKMPFGLVNSGATFNRMMRKMLRGAKDIDNYVDDMLGHTRSWEEHLTAVRDIFSRVRAAHLTMRPTKCLLGYQSLGFVGHTVGKGQIAMETDKLERIANAPQPETKKQVRSFLGLAGYYRKFIPNFAEIAVPLTDLTKKGQPSKVKWEEPHQRAFRVLIDMLTRAPILRLPDFQRPFLVQTDASDVGVGAVLFQEYDDGKFPVAYASKKLLPRERNYSVIERECLAIVFAIKKFQKYLYGKEFVLQTDHQPLAYIQRCKIESGRIMRWALFLQNYRFRIEAIKGSDNIGADYLSRLDN